MSSVSDEVAPWRKWSGYGVVAVLAIVLIAVSLNRPSPTGAPVPITAGSVPVVSTFPPPTTTTPETSFSPPEATDYGANAVRAVLADGLTSWGAFAVTGDLDLVRPWFWEDGPQWANLTAEAPAIEARNVAGPSYSVSMEGVPTAGEPGESATPTQFSAPGGSVAVAGTVRFERPGEQVQEFRWTVLLMERDGEWRIWAVEPTP